MEFINYPEVKHAPLIELGFNNGMATGYEKVEALIKEELPKYEDGSKESLVLNNLLLQVNVKTIEEKQRISELESYLKEAVSYNQQKKKQSLLSRLFTKIKKA
ncbi:hypothetical protein ERX35_005250 [Macrococcus equipercicus]|uniref:Uncharacterized protein n=1 Tax=Macrococcus equipercicus TaxID=69967 RepID=A0ABQ6R8M8_9STAP|nr:hypothetical protein [Macrococcus equipercicus]KAA1039486.1 hypothetical protein ERX35_005250 [Macrococcus equipercicus]